MKPVDLQPPAGLEAETFDLHGLELLILEYPVGLKDLPSQLSTAERHVVELLGRGYPTWAIARERGVSPKTIANQLASVYRKLGVNTREELLVALS